jgi:AGCS family alanine or glycine:cation symporter
MLEIIKNILWSPATIALIVLTGFIISFKTSFRALKHPVKILKSTLLNKNGSSSFEAMCTALGGTIGVGNTIGVAGAIHEGGAGSLLWMLLASLFGMVIKEAEIYLAVKYKQLGAKFSGPMYYIETGIGSKIFAVIWSISCILTAFGMGNISQSMAAVGSINSATGINTVTISIIISITVFILIANGMCGVKKALGATIPVITALFVTISILILLKQRADIKDALYDITHSFLQGENAVCGIKWSLFSASIRAGFSRGIFTNEAGLGSASIVHSSSSEASPEKQAMWGVVEVFIDTVLICMLTGMMILTSDVSTAYPEKTTLNVFFEAFGKWGAGFYSASMLIFALASIIAWYCYAECALSYLNVSNKFNVIFKALFAIFTFLGGIIDAGKILQLSDIFNALMLITNLTALILLSDKIKSD